MAWRTRSGRISMRTSSLSSCTTWSFANDAGTVTYTCCAVMGGAFFACGRFTGMPCVIIGAATMKTIRSTSITSTSGTTLISASDDETRALRPRLPRPPAEGIGCTFGTLGKVPLRDVQELQREIVHLVRELLHLVRVAVVEVDGRHCREQPRGRRHERFRDARRHDRETRRALRADARERFHDSPHRPEQPDERRDARRGREKRHALLEARHLDSRGAQQRPVDGLEAL